MRCDRQDYFSGDPLGLKRTQEIAYERKIADPGDSGAGLAIFFLEQPSQHNGFTISDIEHSFRRAIAELKLGNGGTGLEQNLITKTNDFNFHLQGKFIPQMDGRLNGQFDSGVAEFDRGHRRGRRNCPCCRLTRQDIRCGKQDRLLVSNVNLCLLVIDHANFRSSKGLGIGDLFKEI